MNPRRLTAAAALTIVLASGLGSAQVIEPCDLGSTGDYSGPYPRTTQSGSYAIAEQEFVELESEFDGARIQMALLRPVVPEGVKVPVIATAGPYYHALRTLDVRACEPFLTENFIPQGYAVAVLSVRGTGDSGGCMNMMGPGERSDLNQAITWLGEAPWSTGSVGMIGLSYDGGTPWEVASFGNPHLKTIVPISGVPDLFELMFGQGRTDFRGPGILNGVYYAQTIASFSIGRPPLHTVEATACPEYATGIAASLYSASTGRLDPFGYWAERRYRDEILANYRGSVYLVQGLQDWNVDPSLQYPWIGELEARGVTVHHLLGQWGHARPYSDGGRWDWADVLLGWFDRWVRGDPEAPLPAKYEIEDADDRWRRADTWPDGPAASLWLDPGQRLSASPSADQSDARIWLDPFHTQGGYVTDLPPAPLRDVCLPNLCALFRSDPAAADTRYGGLPEVALRLTPLGPGGQLSVYLYEDDGTQLTRLGWGQFDLRFRNGDEPEEVVAGQPLDVRFTLEPLDVVLHAGSQLVAIVGGGTTGDLLPTVPNYPMILHLGGGLSGLTLGSSLPDPADFFDPPRDE
ncbi:MAG: CocE/NonD family hydrolase [Actinomycetota bacterium]